MYICWIFQFQKGYRLWHPIKRDIIQTKLVEFVEDVYGYEYIYSKKIFETPFTNADSIDEIEDIDTVDEDEESENSQTHEEHVDDNVESIKSHKTIAEEKCKVGRPKKIIKNPWGRAGKSKNIEFNLTEIVEPITYEEAVNSPQSEKWKIAMDEDPISRQCF